jgi:hypothetical protein
VAIEALNWRVVISGPPPDVSIEPAIPRAGARFEGPAIIEERESTTVIGPGARIRVDARLTIIAEPAP